MGASYDVRRRITGIGVAHHLTVRRGRDGRVIAVSSEAYSDVPPGLAEKFAIYRALEIARAEGVTDVKVRSDYNRMRRTLHADRRAGRLGEGRDILHRRVLLLAQGFDRVHFAWIPRRKNQEAHRLARHAVRNVPSRAVGWVSDTRPAI